MTKPLERCTKAEILAVFAQRIEELNAAREALSELRADCERYKAAYFAQEAELAKLRHENLVLRQDSEATDDYETQQVVATTSRETLQQQASNFARNHRCVTRIDTTRGVVEYYDKKRQAWRDVE